MRGRAGRKTERVAALVIAALLLWTSAQACAQAPGASPAPSVVPVRGAALQALLDRRIAAAPGTAIVVGIVDGDRTTIVQAGSSGTARPLDAHTLFEIGSVTKTFTATVLASMVLDRSVGLNDPVATYLPPTARVPSRSGKPITLLNLATQHSGLPRMPDNLRPAAGDDPYAGYGVEQLLAFVGAYRLPRDPGASFEYSNLGIGLLGDALAYRSNTSYAALVRQRVFAPLGMRESLVVTARPTDPRFAASKNADGDPARPWTFDAIAPAGAVASSVTDMLAYVRCQMGRGPLAKTCLFAQQPRSTFPGHRIGLVWWTDGPTGTVEHGGDTASFHAAVAVSRDHRTGVVVLTSGGNGVVGLAQHLVDPRAPYVEMTPEEALPLTTAQLDEYVGDYGDKDTPTAYHIRRTGDHLEAQLAGQPAARVFASAKDTFEYHVVAARIVFVRDGTARVNGVTLYQDGKQTRLQRAGATPLASAPPSAAPSFPPEVPLDAATLDEYVGAYPVNDTVAFTVARSGAGITVMLSGQSALPVYASAKDEFFYKAVDARIVFGRDATGHVTTLTLHQNGQVLTARKR